MAKPFAKKFYNSKEWQGVREATMQRDFFICQHCGRPAEEVHHTIPLTPNNIFDNSVTMNPDNLISLCKDCHFAIHKLEKLEMLHEYNKGSVKHILDKNGYYFDDQGYLCNMKVVIVYGSPRSGKTTYVMQHKNEGDLVIDVEDIIAALQMTDQRVMRSNLLGLALDVREFLFQKISERAKNIDCKVCWIVGGFPTLKERNDLASRLKAELVYIDTPIEECVDRARVANFYGDPDYSEWVVRSWWNKYQRQ